MATLIYNRDANNQFRLVTLVRGDDYQIPNDPDAQAAGIRDQENERDALASFSWVHTLRPGLILTTSPFYHFNRANYDGAPTDTPVSTTQHRASQYGGAQVSLNLVTPKHNASAGVYGFGQHDDESVNLIANDGSGLALANRQVDDRASGGVVSRRSIQGAVVADAYGGRAADAFHRRDFGKRGEPALGRGDSHSAFELGAARVLGRVLSGASALDGDGSAARFRGGAGAGIYSAARRAGSGASVRPDHSAARLGARSEQLSSAGAKLFRSQRDWKFESVFPADH